ncbi:RadC family protein [Staphylococcus sp. 11261D007BR]
MTRIRDLSNEEKPKERLIKSGAKSLSNTELLAILINTGSKGHSSLEIASQILSCYPTVNQLKQLSIVELQAFTGIGLNKAVTLLAAFELAFRLDDGHIAGQLDTIQAPDQVAKLLYKEFKGVQQEHFILFILNTKHHIIHRETLFIGTLNSAVIHPREVFKVALKWSAHAIIVAHNHPSGDTTPSKADMLTTERLMQCGKTMGIELLDHIIIGNETFTSILSEIE